jgi:hypothetical protein
LLTFQHDFLVIKEVGTPSYQALPPPPAALRKTALLGEIDLGMLQSEKEEKYYAGSETLLPIITLEREPLW